MTKLMPVALGALAFAGIASAATTTTTLHLTEKQTFQHYVDTATKGESPGDIRTFGGTIFQNGRKIGHDRIRCVVARSCNAQMWLPGGSLISKGFVANGPRFTTKITGGTGKYIGARGTVTVVGGPVTRYTVRLNG